MARGHGGTAALAPARSNVKLYTDIDPLGSAAFETKVKLLEDMNAYARDKDSRVRQVSCHLSGEWQQVEILRPTARSIATSVRWCASTCRWWRSRTGARSPPFRRRRARRLCDLSGAGLLAHTAVDEALRQALVNLESIPAPAGEMTVVLGPGWPGILLHEAIGHGLEGDFNARRRAPSPACSASGLPRPRDGGR